MLYSMAGTAFHNNISGSNQDGASGSAMTGLGSPRADLVIAGLIEQVVGSHGGGSGGGVGSGGGGGGGVGSGGGGGSGSGGTGANPFDEVATDAILFAHSVKAGSLDGVYASILTLESILDHSPSSMQTALEQAFIDDVFADL